MRTIVLEFCVSLHELVVDAVRPRAGRLPVAAHFVDIDASTAPPDTVFRVLV
jgi:hypothetical protein